MTVSDNDCKLCPLEADIFPISNTLYVWWALVIWNCCHMSWICCHMSFRLRTSSHTVIWICCHMSLVTCHMCDLLTRITHDMWQAWKNKTGHHHPFSRKKSQNKRNLFDEIGKTQQAIKSGKLDLDKTEAVQKMCVRDPPVCIYCRLYCVYCRQWVCVAARCICSAENVQKIRVWDSSGTFTDGKHHG